MPIGWGWALLPLIVAGIAVAVYFALVRASRRRAQERLAERSRASAEDIEEVAQYASNHDGQIKLNRDGRAPRPANLSRETVAHPRRLPFPRDACFAGRADDLAALAELLFQQGGGRVALYGLSGLGKSALALEFAYAYGRRFPGGVFWLNAQGEKTLVSDLVDCGLAMGLEPWPDKQPEQVARVLGAWATDARRLLVLDNVEDIQLLRAWLAHLQGSHLALLVTGRSAHWPPDLGLTPYPLRPLTRGESRALLRKLAPRLDGVPDQTLDEVTERLGRLPLALDLAGHYLADRPDVSVGEYLKEMDAADSILAHPSVKDWVDEREVGHPASLMAAFDVSYRRLQVEDARDVLARRLFAAAGYLAPNVAIPREMLRAIASDIPQADRAMRRLEELGLLTAGEPGPVIHPLLAAFARLHAEDGTLPDLLDHLRRLTERALDTGLPRRFAPLRPHVEAITRGSETLYAPQTAALWSDLAAHLSDVADYAAAKEHYMRVLRLRERFGRSDDPAVARDINGLGCALRALGELTAARECHERALRIAEKAHGPDDPVVARIIGDLGVALQDLGDLPAARQCLERALQINERTHGADHPQVARDVNNLGLVLQNLGDLPAARSCFERALRIDEAALGPDHPAVARDANNLALALRALGELPAAREGFERALRIDEAAFGPDHPAVARDVNNLGLALQDLKSFDAARQCFERALRIDEAAFGADHPAVARDINNLGRMLATLGDLEGARERFERALGIAEKALGPDHPNVATYANNLGSVLHEVAELDAACACFERALRIREMHLPADHPALQRVRANLAAVQGELAEREDVEGA